MDDVDNTYSAQEPKLPLQVTTGEWRTPDGSVIQLCVAHELNPKQYARVPAVTTMMGFAVCRLHMEVLTGYIRGGTGVRTIVEEMARGEFTL